MAKINIWLVGHHAISALLKTQAERAISLLVVENKNNQAQAKVVSQAKQLGLTVLSVDKNTLRKRCGIEQNQSIALEALPKAELNEKNLIPFLERRDNPLLLVLDQVQDPHNFGACLRTADAAGVDAVIVAKDNAAPMSPTVQKVASGAAETMAIYRVTNLARTMDDLKQACIWMIGTSDKAQHSLYQENFQAATALVMGAEGKGLRKLTEEKCDTLISLPMAGAIVSSLNVSVATGVCLYEIVRQRSAISS